MQAVILAGGLGTRLRPLTKNLPKALVPVGGRPLLEWKLEQLKMGGIDDVVLCVGYLGQMIREHFGDGSRYGVKITYSEDGPTPLGKAGALKKVEELLKEKFFVTYGDNYLRLDHAKMMAFLESSGKLGVLAVYHNKNEYGTSDVEIRDGRIVSFKKAPQDRLAWINFGIYALRRNALALVARGRPMDEKEFFDVLIKRGQLLSYEVAERFYEIGNKESLKEFGRFLDESAKVGR